MSKSTHRKKKLHRVKSTIINVEIVKQRGNKALLEEISKYSRKMDTETLKATQAVLEAGLGEAWTSAALTCAKATLCI